MTKQVVYRPSPEQELFDYAEKLCLWLTNVDGVGVHNLPEACIMLECLDTDMKKTNAQFGAAVSDAMFFEAKRH